MTNLENNQAQQQQQQTKKAGPRRLALAQPQKDRQNLIKNEGFLELTNSASLETAAEDAPLEVAVLPNIGSWVRIPAMAAAACFNILTESKSELGVFEELKIRNHN